MHANFQLVATSKVALFFCNILHLCQVKLALARAHYKFQGKFHKNEMSKKKVLSIHQTSLWFWCSAHVLTLKHTKKEYNWLQICEVHFCIEEFHDEDNEIFRRAEFRVDYFFITFFWLSFVCALWTQIKNEISNIIVCSFTRTKVAVSSKNIIELSAHMFCNLNSDCFEIFHRQIFGFLCHFSNLCEEQMK